MLVPLGLADAKARCSFCVRRRDETDAMVHAPRRPGVGLHAEHTSDAGVRICRDCLRLCENLLANDAPMNQGNYAPAAPSHRHHPPAATNPHLSSQAPLQTGLSAIGTASRRRASLRASAIRAWRAVLAAPELTRQSSQAAGGHRPPSLKLSITASATTHRTWLEGRPLAARSREARRSQIFRLVPSHKASGLLAAAE